MKPNTLFLILLLIGLFFMGCTGKQQTNQIEPGEAVQVKNNVSNSGKVNYGKYLVTLAGCNDCHSPKIMTEFGPQPDPDKLLAGHQANEKLPFFEDKSVLQGYVLFNMNSTSTTGPWGTSFAANLTPDETGLGNWTFENFKTAMQKGKFKGMENGRMLLPPMPWPNYTQLSEEDLSAIWAYLQSIPAVKNIVPSPIPPAG